MKKYLIVFLVGSLLFFVLPLLAWGVTDLPRFFGHPARALYALGILLLQAVWAYYLPFKKRAEKDGQKKNLRQMIDLIFIQVLFFFIVFMAPFSDGHSLLVMKDLALLRYAGLVITAAGFLLMLAAEKYLGDFFSVEVTLQEGHRLITTGPYRYIRHPRYLGILLFGAGMSLVFRSFLSGMAVFLLLFVLVWRIAAEDALMKNEFKDQWAAYHQKTWRMIPFIF